MDARNRDLQGGLTGAEKRRNVVRHAFDGRDDRLEAFIRMICEEIPAGTAAILRGSAVTGVRWKEGAPFDVDGPGTSDLDVTLVGDQAVGLFKATGFFVPGVHAAWTERRRVFELRALLAAIARHQPGPHALVGDFNAVAPGELLNIRKLPARLRALVWLSGGAIRWKTIATILEAGYADAFRACHPDEVGSTFPTWDPHIRLDYLFVPRPFAGHVRACTVHDHAGTREASDHLPLDAEIDA